MNREDEPKYQAQIARRWLLARSGYASRDPKTAEPVIQMDQSYQVGPAENITGSLSITEQPVIGGQNG